MTNDHASQQEAVESYLARLDEPQRAALDRLRGAIAAAAPDAVECMRYGLPGFCLMGKAFMAYGAAQNHCALYPMSPAVVEAHLDRLEEFDTSKGTIRFQPEAPLPAELVRDLAAARRAELSRRA